MDNDSELHVISERLSNASVDVLTERGAVCCYHNSDKTWALDPEGIRWETFVTHGTSTVYGENNAELAQMRDQKQLSCC